MSHNRRWLRRGYVVAFAGVLALTFGSVSTSAQAPPEGRVRPSPPVQSGGYTLDAEARPRHIKPGGVVTIEATVIASQAEQNRQVDLEVLDASNQKIAQQVYSGQSFAPGQTLSYRWQWQAPANLPPGDYTVKIGVFTADWQQLIAWDNLAAMFRVGSGTASQPGNYTLSATATPRHVKPGDQVTIEANVGASQAAQNQRVDVEILDANNQKVAQQVYSGQSFAPGQTQKYRWTWQAPPNLTPGIYTVKVGIFSADWQRLIAWENLAAAFRVATGSAG